MDPKSDWVLFAETFRHGDGLLLAQCSRYLPAALICCLIGLGLGDQFFDTSHDALFDVALKRRCHRLMNNAVATFIASFKQHAARGEISENVVAIAGNPHERGVVIVLAA